jgi:multiple sugar transport system substrate-binding protein
MIARAPQRVSRRRFLGVTASAVGAGIAVTSAGRASRGVLAASSQSATVAVDEPSYLQPGYKEQLDGLDQAFALKYPGSRVEQVSPPFPQYHQQVLTLLQAGAPPDIIRIDDPQLQYYIEQDWLEPLDPWLKDAGLNPNVFINAQKDAMRSGRVLAVPRESNPRVFFYNRALYQKAGIGVPTDLAAYREALKKTSDPRSGQFGMGIATKSGDPTGLMIQLMPVVLGFGASFYDGTRPTAADPKVISALRFVKDLWDNNEIPRGLDAVTINNLVTQGKIASIISGSFVYFQAQKANPAVGAQLWAGKNPLPSPATMRATAWWGVPKSAKHKDLAAKYILLLLQPVQQKRQVELTGTLPARPGMVPTDFIAKNPWFKNVVDIGYAGKAVSYFPQQIGNKGSDALVAIGNGVLSILYQGAAPERAMQDVQIKLEHL